MSTEGSPIADNSSGSNELGSAESAKVREHQDALLPSPEHVLSTLEKDGSRRWLKPKLAKGFWWQRRRWFAYLLMVIFVVVPHIKVWGRPLVRLDIVSREFTILGHTFYPTDTLLLALLILSAFISIVFITAVTGRAWCGWACPQTVYMEFLFRPIDRLFEGTQGKGGQSKKQISFPMQLARFAVYILLNSFLAHTFLAFFVGPEQLSQWIFHGSPFQHPVAFAVMAVTTGLLTYDFYFFREQTCLIACPYGRFQSVMLDRQSMIVAYDYKRGEPRKKGKRVEGDAKGDCVDCNQCVHVCPTGIDIRDGLQMECINCTQCIDACDTVMHKIGLPPGLIRYSSQDALERKPKRIIRARTLLYPILLLAVLTGLGFAINQAVGLGASINRGKGAPFTTIERGKVLNSFSLKLVNRTNEPHDYQLEIVSPDLVQIEVVDEQMLHLEARKLSNVPVNITFPSALTYGKGNTGVVLRVSDDVGNERNIEFKILGPRQ